METIEHGGGCCGISHLYDFWGRPSIPRIKEEIDEAMREFGDEAPDPWNYECGLDDKYYKADLKAWRAGQKKSKFNHLFEVVLTDDQMTRWAAPLKKCGFTLGPRFLNSNSGNWCTVLFYQTAKRRGKDVTPRPYTW